MTLYIRPISNLLNLHRSPSSISYCSPAPGSSKRQHHDAKTPPSGSPPNKDHLILHPITTCAISISDNTPQLNTKGR
eukprot:scaffold104831_cov40-Cyclotella_meneghiniana.AAC.1